jgi:sterol desaturase/sphingolipid hydroxylase (fatty acid hydroxylase superfamily)
VSGEIIFLLPGRNFTSTIDSCIFTWHSLTIQAGKAGAVILSEGTIRFSCFVGAFLLLALGELLAPRRRLVDSKLNRWLANLSLVAINTALSRFLLPILPVSLALLIQAKGWGLLNLLLLPDWLKLITALILLDLIIYLQHILFHYQPLLWRLHRVHHTDLDIDVTTGNRFHPFEILISLLIKLAAVAIIGAPATAVVIFEIILNAAAQFNHSNIKLPGKSDQWLRYLVVTPDIHRVHHSVIPHETNSNFGFNIPLWDRLFGTYRDQPQEGQIGMTIGLKEYREPTELGLFSLLLQPFRR